MIYEEKPLSFSLSKHKRATMNINEYKGDSLSYYAMNLAVLPCK